MSVTQRCRVNFLQLDTCKQLLVVSVGVVAYGELINGNVEVLCICDELDRTKGLILVELRGDAFVI